MGFNQAISSAKIAFASYTKQGDIGGVTTWLEALLLRLHHGGIPVALLLFYYGQEVPELGVWTRLRAAGIPVEIEAVTVEDEAANPRVFVKKTINFLNRYRPQIFLPNCRNTLYFAARIAGIQGLPWVFTVHSDDTLFWSVAQACRVKSTNGSFVAVSGHIAKLLRSRRLDSQPNVIPYGVPLSDHTTTFVDWPFKVVYSGRITEEQKRIFLVLQSMALACQLDPRIECWLIGDGPEASASKAWVHKEGLADRIHFAGCLDVVEVRKRVSDFQVVLLMSDYEGLGISLLEAMTCGVVPVVRGLPPVTEFVKNGETGFVVNGSPEQAARAIKQLLSEPNLWLRCSEGARSIVAEEYSEERSYGRWLEFLTELSESSRVRYPLRTPVPLPIPLRYEPWVLQIRTHLTRWKWRLIQVWYQRILPVLAAVKKILRERFN